MNDKAIKIKEQRNALLHVRIKQSSLNLLLSLIARKQKVNKKRIVMADIIEAALRFAEGQIVTLNTTDHDNPTEN